MQFSIKTKLFTLTLTFVVLFIALSAFLLETLSRSTKTLTAVISQTESVLVDAHTLDKLVVDMETGQRGFIITGKEEFLEPFNTAIKQFNSLLNKLRKNLQEYPQYLALLERVEHLQHEWIGLAGQPEIKARRKVLAAQNTLNSISGLIKEGTGKKIVDEMRATMNQLSAHFKKTGDKESLLLLAQTGKSVADAETGQRGFLLTGKDSFLQPYYEGNVNFGKNIRALEKRNRQGTRTLKKIIALKKLHQNWIAKAAIPEINARIQYEKNPASMEDLANLLGNKTGKQLIDQLRVLIAQLQTDLTAHFNQIVSQTKKNITRVNQLSLAIGIGGIVLLLLISFFIARSILNPLKRLTLGAHQIGKGDFSHKINLKTRDELRTLAQAFNQMGKDIQETQALLVQAGKLTAMGQLGAGIAHELNQPLAAIRGYAEIILRETLDNDVHKADIRKIVDMTARMEKIINNVRTFSRASKPEERALIDIRKPIEDALMLITVQLKNHGIEIIKHFAADLPKIQGNSNQLQQIFINLLTNAQDALEGSEDKTIELTTRQIDSQIEVLIKDSGPGIPKEVVDEIFNPFFTTKELGKGTGLGLSISYSIIKDHHGEITVQNLKDGGTQFKITLPIV